MTFTNGKYVTRTPWTVEAFWYGDRSDYDDLVKWLTKYYKFFNAEYLHKDRWDQFGDHWGTLAYINLGNTPIHLGAIVTISHGDIRVFDMKEFIETFELEIEVE